jgi:hypothetical protein
MSVVIYERALARCVKGANYEGIEWLAANWNRREHCMDDRRPTLAAPRGCIEFSRCIGTIPREVAADRVLGPRFHPVWNAERCNRSKPAAIMNIRDD